MRTYLILLALGASLVTAGQPYLIGSRSITYHDDARNRDVPTELYYPAVATGNNTTAADGAFPVIVIGHGFVMTVNAYSNLWAYLVPKGYIVALANTETGFAPDHQTYGEDLAFLVQALQAANADGASPFFGHVAPAAALMGHSMGGGAALLAAAGNTSIAAVVGLAPAETTPSAIGATASIVVPTLILAGANDCVTPIPDHAAPMYAALTVPCRAFASITGGGHCYFAESNFNCSFGELTCSPSPSISRQAQHDVVNDLIGPWFDHFLLGDQQAFGDVLDSLENSTRLVGAHTCALSTGLESAVHAEWSFSPSLADAMVVFRDLPQNALVSVIDRTGREVVAPHSLRSGDTMDTAALPTGTYYVMVRAATGAGTRVLVVTH